MAQKAGSDGQVRKTTTEWSADTNTYPEGERLMDVTTGYFKISKGTTYALAWGPFQHGAGGGGITDLTGDVTASGTGSVAATIAANAVSNTKLADMPALSVKTRADLTTDGDPGDTVLTRPASNGAPRPVLLCDRASGIIGDVLAEKDIPAGITRTAAATTTITPLRNGVLVEGAGTSAVNQTYLPTGGLFNDRAIYSFAGSLFIYHDGSNWIITNQVGAGGGQEIYYLGDDELTPWDIAYATGPDGAGPAPTVTQATGTLQEVLDEKLDLGKAVTEQATWRAALGAAKVQVDTTTQTGIYVVTGAVDVNGRLIVDLTTAIPGITAATWVGGSGVGEAVFGYQHSGTLATYTAGYVDTAGDPAPESTTVTFTISYTI